MDWEKIHKNLRNLAGSPYKPEAESAKKKALEIKRKLYGNKKGPTNVTRSTETKGKQSIAMKQRWKNPEFRDKVLRGRNTKAKMDIYDELAGECIIFNDGVYGVANVNLEIDHDKKNISYNK